MSRERTIAHLLASAYVLTVSTVVVIFEAKFGFYLVTIFGLQYQEKVVYPAAFWLATLGYAWISARRSGLDLAQWAGRAILLGLWVHLNLLVITMAYESEMLPRLNARYFLYYVFGAVGALTAASCAVSAVCCAAYRKGWKDDFWLPVAYLPLAHIVLSKNYGAVVAALEAALLIVALLPFERVHQYVLATARILSRRLTAGPTLVIAIVLAGLVLRLVAAERLGAMGLKTILTNSDDPDQYHKAALQLLKGHVIGKYSSVGYNVFLAAMYWLTGAVVPRALLVQAVIASSVPAGAYLLGARLFDRATGVVAALLAALSQILIFNSVNLAREVAGSVFATWGMYCVVVVIGQGQSRRVSLMVLLTGALFGILMTLDPVFIVVTACLIGAFAACRRFDVGHRLRIGFLFVLVALLSATAIVRFATGETTPYARPDNPQLPIHLSKDFNPYALELYNRRINVFAYPKEFVTNVLAQPAASVGLMARKVWLDARRFLFEAHAGFFDPLLLVHWSFMASNLAFYGYFFGLVGAIAGLGQVLRRPVLLERAALYLVVLCYAGIYVVLFFGMTRFRVPVQPLLLLLVAYGMTSVLRYAIDRSFPTTVAARPLHAVGAVL